MSQLESKLNVTGLIVLGCVCVLGTQGQQAGKLPHLKMSTHYGLVFVFYMANTIVLCFICQSVWHHVIMCIGCAFQRHDMNIFSTLAQQHTQHHTMTTLLPAQSSCIPPFQFHRNSSERPHGAITRSTKEVTKQHILTGSSIDPTHTNRSSTCQYYNTDLPSISLPCLT